MTYYEYLFALVRNLNCVCFLNFYGRILMGLDNVFHSCRYLHRLQILLSSWIWKALKMIRRVLFTWFDNYMVNFNLNL